ncbi:50S ribosomal protein L1 [Spiroplasma endosymbiont of Aspidapion aeneum]|uniref:50S ribosomal protein L1 n=1 Tax=Spiroplasma endosymbiont of Aspidapion aeneum TaxID=3066276 RepID=UPI00313E012A
MAKMSKKLKQANELVDKKKSYQITDAIELIKKTSLTKFDSTIEIAFNLNLDPRHADQQLRGAILLPAGTGKSQKILVLTKTKATEAQNAGADFVGAEDMISKIENENWFDYDVIVATPEMMASLGKIGKILGPKGLMPNPKTGTVTMEVGKAIDEIKKGKVEYRTDKEGNVHLILGKVSFKDESILENYKAVLDIIKKSKPASAKGTYIKNITVSTTMGPGIKVSLEN